MFTCVNVAKALIGDKWEANFCLNDDTLLRQEDL